MVRVGVGGADATRRVRRAQFGVCYAAPAPGVLPAEQVSSKKCIAACIVLAVRAESGAVWIRAKATPSSVVSVVLHEPEPRARARSRLTSNEQRGVYGGRRARGGV